MDIRVFHLISTSYNRGPAWIKKTYILQKKWRGVINQRENELDSSEEGDSVLLDHALLSVQNLLPYVAIYFFIFLLKAAHM